MRGRTGNSFRETWWFLGCSRYPECDYVRPLKSQADGHIVKILEGQLCPECGAVLVLRQGRFGMFIGCSQYPQCEHTVVIDKPDETAIACPACQQGHLVQRRSRYGKIFHSCDRYPECQFVINFTPVAGNAPSAIIRYSSKENRAGREALCASKQCGKPVPVE